MSRLTIDVTEQQHQALKAMAALQGKTIKQALAAYVQAMEEKKQKGASLGSGSDSDEDIELF